MKYTRCSEGHICRDWVGPVVGSCCVIKRCSFRSFPTQDSNVTVTFALAFYACHETPSRRAGPDRNYSSECACAGVFPPRCILKARRGASPTPRRSVNHEELSHHSGKTFHLNSAGSHRLPAALSVRTSHVHGSVSLQYFSFAGGFFPWGTPPLPPRGHRAKWQVVHLHL